MIETFVGGVSALAMSAALFGAAQSTPDLGAAPLDGSFPLVELRQYTLHSGKRDELIELFEREFVESQEAVGMKVIGTFTDLDRPDRFVWLRGFKDMDSRLSGLTAFYDGPVWKKNREAANATMVDSDNVLLLRTPEASADFDLPVARPGLGGTAPAGLIVASIYYLKVSPAEAVPAFDKVRARLKAAGIHPLAWLVPDTAPNNFPRLPVREGEKLLVWFAAFDNEADHAAHAAAMGEATELIAPWLAREPEVLRLRPTARSLLRAAAPTAAIAGSEHDFNFLFGRWKVRHRLLKTRGAGSKEWVEYSGTADTRLLLDGLCNIEEHRIDGRDSGIALRCFDRLAKRWSIYWVSERNGQLQPPVHGGFNGKQGIFEGEDVDGGRPIIVRFLWHRIAPGSATWEQSFSYDRGRTWETNWIMEFQKAEP